MKDDSWGRGGRGGQGRAGEGRGGEGRAGQGRAGQGRAGREGRAGQGRAGEIWLPEINGGGISGEDSVTCPHTDALRLTKPV